MIIYEYIPKFKPNQIKSLKCPVKDCNSIQLIIHTRIKIKQLKKKKVSTILAYT